MRSTTTRVQLVHNENKDDISFLSFIHSKSLQIITPEKFDDLRQIGAV